MHHARMVRRIFGYIGEGGHIPHEWFAAEVTRLDNVSGDIEALADRLAGVRSWAYIAHRADWLADPRKWAERTMEVEARLSDALHERLTQRFVDRRTAVLVRDIGARGSDALPVTVAADGEVSVGPEPIGHLAGFDFKVDPAARLADKRLLLAAAERRLGDELERRAKALLEASDDVRADRRRRGRVAVGWDGTSRPPRPGAFAARARAAHQPRARPPVGPEPSGAARPARSMARGGDRAASGGAQDARRRGDRPGQLARRPRAGRDADRCRRGPPAPRDARRRSPLSSRPTAGRCTACASGSARSICSFRRCSSRARNIGARACRGALGPADAGAAAARRRVARADADPRGARWPSPARPPMAAGSTSPTASPAMPTRSARPAAKDPVDAGWRARSGSTQTAIARLMTEIGFARAGDAWRWRGRRASALNARRAPATPSPRWPTSSASAVRIDRYPALHPAGEKPQAWPRR